MPVTSSGGGGGPAKKKRNGGGNLNSVLDKFTKKNTANVKKNGAWGRPAPIFDALGARGTMPSSTRSGDAAAMYASRGIRPDASRPATHIGSSDSMKSALAISLSARDRAGLAATSGHSQMDAARLAAQRAGGGGGDQGSGSIYDGLSPTDYTSLVQQAAAPTKSLSQYIAEAIKDLGAGTNYGTIRKQLQADTGRSDKNIGTMYAALNADVKGQDAGIVSNYGNEAKQQTAAGAAAKATVNDAYDAARSAVTQRLAALGLNEAGGSSALNADARDQAAAVSTIGQNQQSALTDTAAQESASRNSNRQMASAATFAGNEQRANLQQGLADQLAKLSVQQSTEDASRRQSALQFALSMQGNDNSARSSANSAAISASNNSFNQSLALAKAKEAEAYDTSKANNAANSNSLALAKLKQDLAGQSKSRKLSAASAAYKKGDLKYADYSKYVSALG